MTPTSHSALFAIPRFQPARPAVERQPWKAIGAWLLPAVIVISAGVLPLRWCWANDDDSVVVRVPDEIIDRFCDAVCPLQISGKKRVSVTLLGRQVSQEVPWTAVVTAPRVSITRDKQAFVAKVEATTSAVPSVVWSDEVTGELDVSYDAKREAIVIRVVNVIAPIAIGPLKMDVDVAPDIPEMVVLFRVPDIRVPNQRKTVSVDIEPSIRFEEDTVVVTGKPQFGKGKESSPPRDGDR